MKDIQELLIEWIKRGLEKPGKTKSGLAEAIGLRPPDITKTLGGKRRVQVHEVALIARYLDEPAPPGTQLPTEAKLVHSRRKFEGGILSSADLPVFPATEGGGGVMVISSEPIDWVQRPWFFQHVNDAFIVLVVGESMEPAYQPGDMVMINPRLPPRKGKDAIFIASRDEGDFRSIIKRFRGATDKEFVVEQFNPRKELRLPKNEWKQVFRVVGKYDGA